jgi:hypothetical protein
VYRGFESRSLRHYFISAEFIASRLKPYPGDMPAVITKLKPTVLISDFKAGARKGE